MQISLYKLVFVAEQAGLSLETQGDYSRAIVLLFKSSKYNKCSKIWNTDYLPKRPRETVQTHSSEEAV